MFMIYKQAFLLDITPISNYLLNKYQPLFLSIRPKYFKIYPTFPCFLHDIVSFYCFILFIKSRRDFMQRGCAVNKKKF